MDRKVTVKFKNGLFKCCLEGKTDIEGNRQLHMFSLTLQEAKDLVERLMNDILDGGTRK